MEAPLLTRADHEQIASLAAVKTFGLIREYLKPAQEEKIKTSLSYSVSQVAELFDVTPHTIRNWYGDKKECLLRKNKADRFTGESVKAEFERRNGKK